VDYPVYTIKRPQYFGHLTNDIVYNRLAPGVLDELQRVTPKDEKGRRKHRYFQRLTQNVGYPKLREHLGSVVTLMKLKDFERKARPDPSADRRHDPTTAGRLRYGVRPLGVAGRPASRGSFPRGLGALLGRQLGGASPPALQAALPTQGNSRRVLPLVGVVLRLLAGSLVDELRR
jgi:hypothetical protein